YERVGSRTQQRTCMDRASPDSDRQKRGWREVPTRIFVSPLLFLFQTLRFYWNRTTSAFRSMFSSKQESDEQPGSVRDRGNSYQHVPEMEADHEVAVVNDISGTFTRQWEPLCNHQQEETSSPTFRVASYNVLCQMAVEKMAHLDASSPLRSWSHRSALLAKEISSIDADILGLQDISESVFEQDFKPLLERLGYSVIFFENPMEDRSNGLVLAVKKEKFEFESQETVDYFQKDDAVLNSGNIGQIARVVCRATKSSMILAHTQLLYDPRRGDTKIAQIAYLLSRVHQLRRDDEPVFCLGDFNIEPASKIFDYITKGVLNATKFSIQNGSGQIPEDSNLEPEYLYELPRETFVHTMMDRSGKIRNNLFELLHSLNTTLPNQFTHRLKLYSVYTPRQPSTVSSLESGAANPDYIFYDAGKSSALHLTRRFSLPTVEDLSGAERWPNSHLASSHIALAADFTLQTT
ncbi:hypothetical protein PMAYCL1PPCAC_32541, partial [Pristionchus mayeri]